MIDECHCNGAVSGGLPLPHPRGWMGCRYALDRPHTPGTDYYDGRDGSIEAEDDDEDRIAAEDAAAEEWSEYLEWQRSLGA